MLPDFQSPTLHSGPPHQPFATSAPMKPTRLIAVFPTLLTLGNGACGFGAITFAAKVTQSTADAPGHGPLFFSALLIFGGMLFDMFDGAAARLTGQTSQLGAELDSLCDAITFGVAPAFLMLQFVNFPLWEGNEYSLPFIYPARLVWTIGALYMLCAILRLARFNIETEEDDAHDSFSGLPSPAAAGAVAAFPIVMPELLDMAQRGNATATMIASYLVPGVKIALPLVCLAVAMLMVSRIRYPHFGTQIIRGRGPRKTIIQVVFAAAAVAWVHELVVPLAFCYFAFNAPILHCWKWVFGRQTPADIAHVSRKSA